MQNLRSSLRVPLKLWKNCKRLSHVLFWKENGKQQQCQWKSNACKTLPRNIIPLSHPIEVDDALKTMKDNIALLWKGDYEEGKRFYALIAKHFEVTYNVDFPKQAPLIDKFYHLRFMQQERIEVLSKFILSMRKDQGVLQQKAKVRKACYWSLGEFREPYLLPLREVLGIMGAYQWKVTGILIPQLNKVLYPDYTVYAPSARSEYLDLLLRAPINKHVKIAFDIGTGTGILSAFLKHRKVPRVIATDINPRAVKCATENLHQMGFANGVEVMQANVYPADENGQPLRADLIVCNPPWIPYTAHTALDMGSYDTDSRMLHVFLSGLKRHLTAKGVAFLIMSDFAELIGLRTRDELLQWIKSYQLEIVERIETVPSHPKVFDKSDPLHEARSREVTSLWILRVSKLAFQTSTLDKIS